MVNRGVVKNKNSGLVDGCEVTLRRVICSIKRHALFKHFETSIEARQKGENKNQLAVG